MIKSNELKDLEDTYLSSLIKAIPDSVKEHVNEMKTIDEFNLYIQDIQNYQNELSHTFHNHGKALFLPEDEYQNFVNESNKEGYDLGLLFAKSNYFTIETILKLTHSTRMCGIRHVLKVIENIEQKKTRSILIERFYEITNIRQNSFFHGYIHEQNEHLRTQSITDPLTGLYNRRYFYEHIVEELIKDNKDPISLMVIDINNFKRINDEFGHREGDRVLEQFSAIISENCSDFDRAFRFGGDEFILILPVINEYNVEEMARRLDNKINQYNSQVSLSFGISQIPATDSPEKLNIDHYIRIADTKMYKYKTEYKEKLRY
ncbi:GGDEF domain-containing protein [Halobacillus seohaensis]|uniref:GGDEF domain-containing protein n=1 Tax=Halobacillus seohaensis TaxID=447421 RepID=A0ABW2EJM0_9BACI